MIKLKFLTPNYHIENILMGARARLELATFWA